LRLAHQVGDLAVLHAREVPGGPAEAVAARVRLAVEVGGAQPAEHLAHQVGQAVVAVHDQLSPVHPALASRPRPPRRSSPAHPTPAGAAPAPRGQSAGKRALAVYPRLTWSPRWTPRPPPPARRTPACSWWRWPR